MRRSAATFWGGPAPTFVGAGAQAFASGSTTTVARPTVQAGDIMLTFIGTESFSIGFTTLAGWTLVRTAGGSEHKFVTYRKVATGSEPSDYTWSFGASIDTAARVVAYRGLAASPVDTSAEDSAASRTFFRFPSLTLAAPRLLVGCGFSRDAWTGIAPPAGMTERCDDLTSGLRIYVADQYPVSGATGVKDATRTGADSEFTTGISLALIPA